MKTVEAAVIGTGWCGGIRAETLRARRWSKAAHRRNPARNAWPREGADQARAPPRPTTGRSSENEDISVVYISATPETNHYPIARDCLKAGKHVLLEKPIAIELQEADELIALAKRNNLKFTIGYSQRFNPKFAYAKKKIDDGTLGKVVSVLVSRHITRALGTKIGGRAQALPRRHGIDARPRLRVLVPGAGEAGAGLFAGRLRRDEAVNGSLDNQWITVTMDNGVAGRDRRRLEPAAGLSEFLLDLDRDHRHRRRVHSGRQPPRQWLNTMKDGMQFPMSSMPGE